MRLADQFYLGTSSTIGRIIYDDQFETRWISSPSRYQNLHDPRRVERNCEAQAVCIARKQRIDQLLPFGMAPRAKTTI
jgi:hypothetical protein